MWIQQVYVSIQFGFVVVQSTELVNATFMEIFFATLKDCVGS